MALEKAIIIDTASNTHIPVQFNPGEYTLNRSNSYAQAIVPGRSAPILQFVSGEQKTLELELLVDTHEEHREGSRVLNKRGDDVRVFTRAITCLMEINPALHAPPVLLFVWGSLSFTCVLARVSQKFVMFRPDGVPVRARLQVTFHEYANADMEPRECKRETADYSKSYVVRQGDTLSRIAAALYDDPGAWRPIAIQNQIDDPRVLPIGKSLLVPRLPFTDPETGEVLR
jgi:nucleoid-associated protein YgaU